MILYVLAMYLALVLLVYLFQRQMLYFPGAGPPQPALMSSFGLSAWPAGEEAYLGLLASPRVDTVRGTVMVFHGNAGTAGDRLYYLPPLLAEGFRVILYEYPGYGGRGGSPSETRIVEDVRNAIHLAHQAYGVPLILWGESLGSGVAASAVADGQQPVDALVLLTPWDSLPALAQSIYWYLPARWLVRDRYESVKNLRGFGRPVAVLMAENDEIIPRRHSMKLYESITGRKRLWIFPGAGHNSWPTHASAEWWTEVTDYLVSGE